jgi:hypothetical protein
MAETENIPDKAHDLLLYALSVLAKFPRDHKFTLGDRVLNRLLDFFDHTDQLPLTRAYLL